MSSKYSSHMGRGEAPEVSLQIQSGKPFKIKQLMDSADGTMNVNRLHVCACVYVCARSSTLSSLCFICHYPCVILD